MDSGVNLERELSPGVARSDNNQLVAAVNNSGVRSADGDFSPSFWNTLVTPDFAQNLASPDDNIYCNTQLRTTGTITEKGKRAAGRRRNSSQSSFLPGSSNVQLNVSSLGGSIDDEDLPTSVGSLNISGAGDRYLPTQNEISNPNAMHNDAMCRGVPEFNQHQHHQHQHQHQHQQYAKLENPQHQHQTQHHQPHPQQHQQHHMQHQQQQPPPLQHLPLHRSLPLESKEKPIMPVPAAEEEEDFKDCNLDKHSSNTSAASAARARKRINDSFKQLAGVCGCAKSKRPGILRSAIEKVRVLEEKIRTLEDKQKEQAKDNEVLTQDLRQETVLDMSSGMAPSPAAIIRSVAQLSRVPNAALSQTGRDWTPEYQHIFDNGNLYMMVVGTSTKVTNINNNLCQMLGYQTHEVEDKMTVFQLTHPSSLTDTLAMGSRLHSKPHHLHRYKKIYVHKLGHLVNTIITTWLSFNAEGQATWCHSVTEPLDLLPEAAQ